MVGPSGVSVGSPGLGGTVVSDRSHSPPRLALSIFAPLRLGAFNAAPSVSSFLFDLLFVRQHSLSRTMASWPRILGGPTARVFVP